MTTIAWLFMGTAFLIISGAAVLSLNRILRNNK